MSESGLPIIYLDPEVMGGVPVFAGSRLPIQTLLDCIDAGDDWSRLVRSWPFLAPAHVRAAREYLAAYPSRD